MIIDTNVVVSALIASRDDTPPTRILQLVREGMIEPLLSNDLLEEYREVLSRDRLKRWHKREPDEIANVLREIQGHGLLAHPPDAPLEGPDPKDNHLWRLLRAYPESVLIAGDRVLKTQNPTTLRVLTPREWMDEIGSHLMLRQ